MANIAAEAASRTDLMRQASRGGAWESIAHVPDPRLRPYVARYEGYVQREPRMR